MKRCRFLGASLLLPILAVGTVRARDHEMKTLESVGKVLQALHTLHFKDIPRSMLHDAAGVAIIPHIVKAGLVVDVRFGRGVILRHEPDGKWSNPVFVSLSGAGIGGQAGVEATDLVLVFKTKESLDRALRGKLALGEDVTIAAGPIGRDAEVARDGRLKADIYAYSRSRGLFAGVSLEGSHVHVDSHSNKEFYGVHKGHADEVLAYRGAHLAAVESLKEQLARLSWTTPACSRTRASRPATTVRAKPVKKTIHSVVIAHPISSPVYRLARLPTAW
jgi:lipid-binding SYLF domain-containing protein